MPQERTCICNHRKSLTRAVGCALNDVVTAPGALSVLRNGGWEQWIRNHVLLALDYNKVIGFNEAGHKKNKRADMIFFCRTCNATAFAIEVETNYVVQGKIVINARISEAIDQLSGLIADGVPTYLFYTLTHLRGGSPADIVSAQNAPDKVWYKHFDENSRAWPTQEDHNLPSQYCLVAKTSKGVKVLSSSGVPLDIVHDNIPEECVAEVRAYIAEVQITRTDSSLGSLTFLNENAQGLTNEWVKRAVIYGKGKRMREVKQWTPF